jgi:hypothetical protein
LCSPLAISNTLDISSLAANITHHFDVAHFGIDIGATHAHYDKYLFPEVSNWYFLTEQSSHSVASINFVARQGVKPEELAKVWRIPLEAACQTLDVTSQRYV